jgi:TolB-like protein/Tfp pilus assembly protein PilF
MSLLQELRRRNVLKVAAVYGVAGWVILQVADILLPILGAPDWGMRLVFGLLVLGFPIAVILAWKYEITPEGIKRESEVDPATAVTAETGRRIYVLIGVLAAIAVVIMVAGRVMAPEDQEAVTDADNGEDPASVGSVPENSVAVLPFVNMSGDPANDYFSDGLAEELLHSLAAVPDIQVAARTSSFHFKGHTGDVAAIARDLRVRHVLEGSVRQSANALRVTAQLIDSSNGYHVWSETYDRELEDVFAIQDDIARRVTEKLKGTLGEGNADLGARLTDNTAAYLAYLKGRELVSIGSMSGYRAAIEQFNRATKLDPHFAEAWAQLAIAWAYRAFWESLQSEQAGPYMIGAADRALELAPDLPQAWLAGGLAHAWSGPDTLYDDEVHDEIARAVEAAPHDADVVSWYAWSLLTRQWGNDALGAIEKALIRDPYSPALYLAKGWIMWQSHKFEQAIELALRAIELAPDNPQGYELAASAAGGQGRFDLGIRYAAAAIPLDPEVGYRWQSLIARYYLALGDVERARQWLRLAQAADRNAISTRLATAKVAWFHGDRDAAARAAERFFADQLDDAQMIWESYWFRAVLFEQRLREGQPEQAIDVYMEGREIETLSATESYQFTVLRHFFILPALQLVNPAQAETVASEILAVVRAPNNWLGLVQAATVRCGLAAFQGRIDDALSYCRREHELGPDESWLPWQMRSMFDPIRETPEWQAFTDEIEAEFTAQLAEFRASGDEPIPGVKAEEKLVSIQE